MDQQKLKVSKSIIFGPVPSRRLGRSLGVNNIPPKFCTYSCAYCQLGDTKNMQVRCQAFYEPGDIIRVVREKIEETRNAGETIDYLTFVPDGEPTLDIHLGQEIDLLKQFNIPIAVITNTSLIWQQEVQNALMEADCVSLKFDTVDEAVWHRINRPHKELRLSSILEGALGFARSFRGKLLTETMILKGINDSGHHVSQLADFLAQIQPAVVYISIPTRPPAQEWAQPPDGNMLNRVYQVLKKKVECVEYLICYEGDAFSSTGDTVEEDVLSITAVHPMRDDALQALLEKSGKDWEVIRRMQMLDQLIESEYMGHKFYLRKFGGNDR